MTSRPWNPRYTSTRPPRSPNINPPSLHLPTNRQTPQPKMTIHQLLHFPPLLLLLPPTLALPAARAPENYSTYDSSSPRSRNGLIIGLILAPLATILALVWIIKIRRRRLRLHAAALKRELGAQAMRESVGERRLRGGAVQQGVPLREPEMAHVREPEVGVERRETELPTYEEAVRR